jgi:hypothetical protein
MISTIKAANPQMQTAIQYAKTPEAKEAVYT